MADLLMPVKTLVESLDALPSSIALRESQYVWGYVLIAHLVSMCVFAGTVVMMDLRLLGVGNMQTPFSQVQKRLFPWQMVGMTFALLTGAVLVFAQPVRTYYAFYFWMKMVLMGLAAVNALAFHHLTYPSIAEWDRARRPPFAAKLAGVLGLVLWASVVITGRLIPYSLTWFSQR